MKNALANNLLVSTDSRGVCSMTLHRPDKHNAFDGALITTLYEALMQADNDKAVRIVIITGKGQSFSSGADVNWMRSMINFDHDTNYHDALQLATLLHTLYSLSKPTIARINGSAFGGALGLIACCDIAISVEHAKFAFTEVLLGLVPAVISPYIIAAIGQRQTKRLFLSAERFDTNDSCKLGLLHRSVAPEELDNTIETEIKKLLKTGPVAQGECKQLIHRLSTVPDDISQYTAELIARLRISDEGQEGINAFLDKRKPDWIQ